MLNNFKYTKEDVERVISESPDMITALEAVGAMYGIPSSHMMAQPGLKSIRVENDMILAPSDVKPNTKAIVCAIGAVLDHISQRINDKIDNFQTKNITQGKIDDKVAATANPNKGNVISHHTLSDGSEVIVYDSGLVDMPHTPEARMKVAELRAKGEIPNIQVFNDSKKEYQRPSFFTPEEDNIALDSKESYGLKNNDPTPVDMSEVTGESDLHLEMCAHYHDTDHLGYDILQEQGFDYVRITEAFITEAAKKKKGVVASDIKHMKFDNKEIMAAIKCLNQARDEQKSVGKGDFNIKALIEHPKYAEAIQHLGKQFDCQLSVYWHTDKEHPDDTSLFTVCYFDLIAQNLTVSKSKGFQLNGLPIQIHCYNKAIDEEMSREANLKMFGQFVCAGLCHEIFHNIANAIRLNNGAMIFTMQSAISMAAATDNARKKREIFERYAKTIANNKNDPVSAISRKRLVSALCKASALSNNSQALRDLQSSIKPDHDATEQVEQLIKHYEDAYQSNIKIHNNVMKRGKKFEKSKGLYTTLNIISIILMCTIVAAPLGILMALVTPNSVDYAYMKKFEDYLKIPNKEEFYCDLFAGMYQLPLSFTIGYKKRDFTANMIPEEQLQRLTTIENKLMTLFQSQYPTLQERNYAANTIAKELLAGKTKLAPEIKEYCQWVVDNYSNMDKTDIGTNFRSQSFDPKEAEDLDRHVQNLIDNNDIKLTEYSTM